MARSRRRRLLGLALLHLRRSLGSVASPLGSLAPEAVWRHFDLVRRIPRCSGNEAGLAAYVRSVAEERGFVVATDGAKNLIVKRPADDVDAPAGAPVIVQTHLDMVCEKSTASAHDFNLDPIAVSVKDGWVIADNTTLGADNGIGVSMALSLLEAPGGHLPPLEFVFTVQEETGLVGAAGIDAAMLSGTRLLNFDSEEHGVFYIGCAGGGDVTIELPVSTEDLPAEEGAVALTVRGLKGGHSGADIHLGRGNAILLLARAAAELARGLPDARLLGIEGGNLDNAIPREATALLRIPGADLPAAQALIDRVRSELRVIFAGADPGLQLDLAEAAAADVAGLRPLTAESAGKLLDLLLLLPHGPMRHSTEVPGLVETSNNVARVRRIAGAFVVLCFARSSLRPALDHARDGMRRLAERFGAVASFGSAFPGWAANGSSELLALAGDAFEAVEGRRAKISAIHAGLECGVIGEKLPGIDMVSLGPDIVGAHAPGERVRVESVARTWKVIEQLLRRLSGHPASAPEL